MMTPISKNNVSDEAYDQLLSAIVRQDYLPGSKLPSENELSDLLQVSRNTVRQAVQKLNVLGLTETKTGKGTYVKQVDVSVYMNFLLPLAFLGDNDYLMLMEFRRGIEIECARLAAERATDEDIKTLEDLMKVLSETSNDLALYSEADTNFHVSIAKFSKNKMCEKVMNMVKYLLSVKFEEYIRKFGNESSIKVHYRILQAIREHNPADAANYMNQHLTNIINQVKESMAREGTAK